MAQQVVQVIGALDKIHSSSGLRGLILIIFWFLFIMIHYNSYIRYAQSHHLKNEDDGLPQQKAGSNASQTDFNYYIKE
jgi:hypothetical protein